MAGGTHAFDMIKRLKENENLKKNNYFKTKGAYTRVSKSINVDFRIATNSEREEIRRRLVEEREGERRRLVLTLILSTALTAIIIFLFFRYVWP
jgi:hypothetical protein